MWRYVYQDELYHHGVKGMKWGVRRYQNNDGSLTGAGKSRYGSRATAKDALKIDKYREKINSAISRGNNLKSYKYSKKLDKLLQKAGLYDDTKKEVDNEMKRLEPAMRRRKPSEFSKMNKENPWYNWNDWQKMAAEDYYKKELSKASKRIKASKTEKERQDRIDDYTVIEMEYQDIFETD